MRCSLEHTVTNLLSFQVSCDNSLVLSNVRYTDTDGDGQGDLLEQAAGTDPNSSASELTVTSITWHGSGQNVLVFHSVFLAPSPLHCPLYRVSLRGVWRRSVTAVP